MNTNVKIIGQNRFIFLVKNQRTFRSLSSEKPMSLPCATANRLPCTRLPTITEAGPTDVSVTHPDELPET